MALFILTISMSTIFLAWTYFRKRRRNPPLPPSPPADPIIGHVRHIPATDIEMFFYELGKKYGDVVYLNVLGKSMIVLNNAEVAFDLLDKRSSNYSDRPGFPIFELMGWERNIAFMRYGKQFQTHRRLLLGYLGKKECTKYQPFQTREARVLVQNLIADPEGREGYLTLFATAIIIRLVSGHQVTSSDDPYMRIGEEMGPIGANSGTPGSTPVDFFPIIKNFPAWFPGTYYASYARSCRKIIRELHEFPYHEVQEQLKKGIAKPSFLASHLEALNDEDSKNAEELEDILGAAAAMYAGGAGTTSSSISIFFLAIVTHPEIQKKAQEELDRVIGPDRLPELSDRSSLPYLECLLQETLRWNHPAPTGVPHRSLEDDTYNGMLIPAGSIVIANIRGMTLDERIYSNPFEFNPDRFMPKNEGGLEEPAPTSIYGFGRRVCPGKYIADESLWIVMATLLATTTISKAIGDDGKEIMPDIVLISGLTSHPKPFRCNIKPRNDIAEALIAHVDTSDTY